MTIPMLEELPAVLADAEVQPYAFHIRVLGFPAGAVNLVSGKGLYGAFGEGEPLHGRPPFVVRVVGSQS